MLGLATLVATLLRLRARACVVLACLAAMLCAAAHASALERVQPKTRVWGFGSAAALNIRLHALASPEHHPAISPSHAALASASLLAAEGVAAGVRYGPMNAGPLPEAIANTFRGGSYIGTTLSEATTFYRAYGGTAGQLGSFWSRTAPSGPLQATIDLALNPAWGNTTTNVATIQVPAGTMVFEGAAAQGGLVGGGSPVFIPVVQGTWLIP